jgi:hypothetical protein
VSLCPVHPVLKKLTGLIAHDLPESVREVLILYNFIKAIEE